MMQRLFRATGLLMALGGCQERTPSAPVPTHLILADSVDHVEALAREPMVVLHPSGTLFVTGYWDPIPPLFRSVDRGASWSRVNIGTATDGATGNSDVDLAVGPDGTLYLLALQFDRAGYAGTSIHVAVSRDVGATWRWVKLSETRGDDRPWIEVSPDGTVHAIWNDGAGVSHAFSTDRGTTWRETERANPLGGSSHLAVGPGGQVAVRFVPLSASGNRFDAGVDGLAISTDRGATWERHSPPATLAWSPLFDTTVTPPKVSTPEQPRWVEPLAWDSAGALYSVWGADSSVWLGRSTDRGDNWTRWKIAEGEVVPHYPYLIARGQGDLAASWFSGKGDSLRVNVARIAVPPDSGAPSVARAPSFQPDSWVLPGFGPATARDAAGEYIPLVFLADGSLGLVAPIQNAAAKRMGFTWRRYLTTR